MSGPSSGELSWLSRPVGLLLALAAACCLLVPAADAAVLVTEQGDTVTTPHFEWNFGDEGGAVERVEGLKWRRSAAEALGPNLAAAGGGGCGGDPSEFWGQSYGNADGQGPGPVVAGNRGTWTPRGGRTVEISTIAPEGCSGDTPPIPVRTRYSFFDEGAAANTVRMERRWSFAPNQEPYAVQGLRAYVPRLPSGTYNQVQYRKDDGSLVTEGLCNVCLRTGSGVDDWDQTWLALNASGSNAGMLLLRAPGSTSPASITIDFDSSSGSNNSGITLDRPLPDGWREPLTETEYICFYDETTWPPAQRATTLPQGCAAPTVPINTQPPAISAGAGAPRAGERFFAAPGLWDNATGAFAYQWSRCLEDVCQPIAGASGTEYVATAADLGRSLKVSVTATAPGGESDSAESNIAGSISGHVYLGSKGPATLVGGALVQVCRRSGAPCRSTVADGNGFYRLQAPLIGRYRVTAFPPAGLNAVSRTRPTISRVKAEVEKTEQDIVLGVVKPPPPQVGFGGAGVRGRSAEGVPVVHWQEPFVIEYESGLGNEVEAKVEFPDGRELRLLPQQPVAPSPKDPTNGIFKFPVEPLIPNHGGARVTIVVHGQRTQPEKEADEAATEEEEGEEEEEAEEEDEEEEENEEEDEEPEEDEETPEEEDEEEEQEEDEEQEEEDEEDNPGPGPGPGEPEEETTFPIYIDPSGYVRSVTGAPLGGARVTLYQAQAKDGPFAVVPDGSAVMSPMNRINPDFSETDGHFGWDVIAGFYKVAVQMPGCHAPGNVGQALVETAVMTIPPPVTDLDLRLECDGDPGPPLTPKPPLEPRVLPRPRVKLLLPAKATVKVGKDGRFKIAAASLECPAGGSSCAADLTVTAPAPPKKPGKGKRARAKAKALLKLGTSKLTVVAGKTAALEGKLSASGLQALKKAKRLKGTITVAASISGGDGADGSIGATLQAPAAKKPPRSR